MKILFITDYFHPHIGGVEKLFFMLASRLRDEGHEVVSISWNYSRSLPDEETYHGIKMIRARSFSRFFFSLIALPHILREARKADLIHTSTYSSALGARIAARLTGTKAVITVHEAWGALWKELPFLSPPVRYFFRMLERIMLRLPFEKYISVSESTRQQLMQQGIKPEKISVIHNGLDGQWPKWEKPSGPFTFCFFGRAGISKGLDLLIPAFERLLEKHPGIRLKLIASPQSKKVERFIVKSIRKESVKGSIERMSDLTQEQLIAELLSSHCAVVPSYSEGFGFTAAEVTLMGLPLIHSGKGSLPEVTGG
ncbi:MAG TPA: glycosyltransferase family 4 protein, partial [Prolixibacteraceae bacterium]|nr:glycosyltransferase family 4 protein [Prolixibacteraceae bacterium]